jgi:hypothetical protein
VADISNPNDPAKKVEGSVDNQSTAQKDDSELQSGSGTTVKGPGPPSTKGKTEEERKESRERLKTVFIILAFIVSCLALGLSCLSYSSSKRSADAAEKSAAAAQRNATTAEKALALSIRPQLIVERIFDLVLVPGRGVELKLQLANTGNGSAKSPSSTIRFGTCPREAGGECFDACPTKTDSKRTIPGLWSNIDPKTSVKWVYEDHSLTSAEEIESITMGTRLLYVCGIHSYTDLFSNPYDSFFCFGYDGSVKRWAGCGIGPRNTEKKNTK